MLLYGWWPLIVSHQPVTLSSYRPSQKWKSNIFHFFHVTSRDYVIQETCDLLCSLWLLFISHYPIKFGSQRPRGGEHITFFICHVTSCDHVINKLYDFVVGGLPSLPTKSFVKVEIQSIFTFNLLIYRFDYITTKCENPIL